LKSDSFETQLDVQKWISGLLMFPRGHAKHSCVQSTVLQGLAVGAIRPYPCSRIRP